MTGFHIEYAMIIKLAVAMLAGFLLSRGLRDAPGGPDPRPAC